MTWDTPAPEVRLTDNSGRGSNKPKPTRTIASVSPLPQASSSRNLGSTSNRRDVTTGRATVIVDTLESAARRLSSSLTPETIAKRKVDTATQAASASPAKLLIASLAGSASQTIDITDVRGLDFKNPFADVRSKSPTVLAAQEAIETIHSKQIAAENASKKETPKTDDTVTTSSSSSSSGAASTGSARQEPQSKPHSNASNVTAPATANRAPSQASKHRFSNMSENDLKQFLTSSYRTVSTELENPEFAQALAANGIRIHDHENRTIGALKPKVLFIYDQRRSRLIQRPVTSRD
jgi:hypothetical protein